MSWLLTGDHREIAEKYAITLSMSINFVAVLLGVLGVMTPVVGALVHNADSILVVHNAALLYDRKLR